MYLFLDLINMYEYLFTSIPKNCPQFASQACFHQHINILVVFKCFEQPKQFQNMNNMQKKEFQFELDKFLLPHLAINYYGTYPFFSVNPKSPISEYIWVNANKNLLTNTK